MKKTIAKIVQHRKSGQIACMRATIVCVKMFNDFQAFARILTLIALCLSSWFTAGTAQAQEATRQGFELASAEVPGRLFALDTAESAPTPSLQLSMAEPHHFRISDSLQSSVARPNGHHTTERMDFPGFYPGNFTLALAVLHTKYGPPASNHPLNTEPVLSEVEAKYQRWESNLADSRSLTNVNGVSVYPLAQIDSGNWHLPITLGTAPTPGAETRW
ncbi:MAG: hypothetical protein ABSD30_05525 [Candidatus Binatus sp.]|jgi:hypothetical protein